MDLFVKMSIILNSILFIGLYFLFRNKKDFFSPIGLIFGVFALQYIIPALLIMKIGYSPFGERWGINKEIISYIGLALVFVNIYILAFSLGIYVGQNSVLYTLKLDVNHKNLKKITLLTFYIWVMLIIIFLIYYKGVQYLLQNFKLPKGSGWINLLLIYITKGFLPYMLWYYGYKYLSLLIIVIMSLFYGFSNARANMFLVIFYFCLYLYYLDKRRYSKYLFLTLYSISGFIIISMLIAEYQISVKNIIQTLITQIGRIEQLCTYIWFSLEYSWFELGKNLLYSILGPFYKFVDYIDYRNVISAIIFGLNPKSFRYGMGGSGVADAWINFGLGGIFFIPFILGIIQGFFYQKSINNGSVFEKLLYINITIFNLGAYGEMLSFSKFYEVIGPLLFFSLLAGVKKNKEGNR